VGLFAARRARPLLTSAAQVQHEDEDEEPAHDALSDDKLLEKNLPSRA
jgi:hypothetical protein